MNKTITEVLEIIHHTTLVSELQIAVQNSKTNAFLCDMSALRDLIQVCLNQCLYLILLYIGRFDTKCQERKLSDLRLFFSFVQ